MSNYPCGILTHWRGHYIPPPPTLEERGFLVIIRKDADGNAVGGEIKCLYCTPSRSNGIKYHELKCPME